MKKTTCPTCGSEVKINDNKGVTRYFIPLDKKELLEKYTEYLKTMAYIDSEVWCEETKAVEWFLEEQNKE